MSRRERPWRKVLRYIAFLVLSVFFLGPFVWQLRSSLLSLPDIFAFPPIWLPRNPQWENYVQVFSIIPFATYYLNTIIIVIINIVGSLFSNVLIAFALARIPFRGRKVLFAMSIGTLMLPSAVTMIPMYMEWSWLGGLNSFLPLTVPSFFGNAFFIFLLVQFFRGIPREYDEGRFHRWGGLPSDTPEADRSNVTARLGGRRHLHLSQTHGMTSWVRSCT